MIKILILQQQVVYYILYILFSIATTDGIFVLWVIFLDLDISALAAQLTFEGIFYYNLFYLDEIMPDDDGILLFIFLYVEIDSLIRDELG